MRVIEVTGLGWDAALVSIEGECLLLIDSQLGWDKRMDVMNEAMAASG
jgi:hypothetical protein